MDLEKRDRSHVIAIVVHRVHYFSHLIRQDANHTHERTAMEAAIQSSSVEGHPLDQHGENRARRKTATGDTRAEHDDFFIYSRSPRVGSSHHVVSRGSVGKNGVISCVCNVFSAKMPSRYAVEVK